MSRKRAKHKQAILDQREMTYHVTSQVCGNCRYYWSWKNEIDGRCNPKHAASDTRDCSQIRDVLAFGTCDLWEPKS